MLEDAISVTKQYEEVIATQIKKIIGLMFRQGVILKDFKETENIYETVGLSRSSIYSKINLYNFVKKYRRTQHSTEKLNIICLLKR